jgi:RNA polymerase sigma-B factor
VRLHATTRLDGAPEVARIDITGDIDVESGALVDACVATACRAAAPLVVLDLTGVRALDEAGVAALASARDIVEAAGRRFQLAGVSAAVRDTLAAAGLDHCVAPAGPDRPVHAVPDLPSVAHGELIRTHRALADRLAHRFAGRGQETDDLRQVAYVGLVTAAQRFDPDRGVRFATFAQVTIVGELKKYFRDHAWQLRVARPVQELYLAVRGASEDLTQTMGRTPTPAELAAALGVSEEQVIESLEARSALHVDSLDRPRGDDDGPWFEEADVEDGYRIVEERSWLVPALRTLPPRDRLILKLRFFDGLPQSAIAARVGISQMHVSRLLARSLATLRAAAGE